MLFSSNKAEPLFREPTINALQNAKINPQARYSAVAEAVALADAERKGNTVNSQNAPGNQNAVRRMQSSRPLCKLTVTTADSDHSNAPNDLPQNNPFPKRKSKPSSMALVAPIEVQPECFYCLEPASHLCNWCRVVYYCGPSHYNIHRCHSKCWPFKVKGWIHIGKEFIFSFI